LIEGGVGFGIESYTSYCTLEAIRLSSELRDLSVSGQSKVANNCACFYPSSKDILKRFAKQALPLVKDY
jgi:hypothetical protein